MRDKRLPAETVILILLPAESKQEAESGLQSLQEAFYPAQQFVGRKQNHRDSLSKKAFLPGGSLGRKQETADSLRSQI